MKPITTNGWLKDVNDNFDTLDYQGGEVYYVDNNFGLDANIGASWNTPF